MPKGHNGVTEEFRFSVLDSMISVPSIMELNSIIDGINEKEQAKGCANCAVRSLLDA